MKSCPSFGFRALAFVVAGALSVPASAQVIDSYYSSSYSLTDLGSISGVPPLYGGLTLLAGDTNTLLIGGQANTAAGALYSVGLTRDSGGHITGFGAATLFADAAYNDGGLAYGPGGVLFAARWPVNELGQIKPGSSTTDKVIDMGALGVAGSTASIAFVPTGHNGAGQMKLVTYGGGEWYSLGLAPDGSGTYDVTSVTHETTIGGGPEGIAYVPLYSPIFGPTDSVLVAEYAAGNVVSYETDANGDPIVGTRRTFISGLTGAEGAFIDSVTGDFIFSTFGGGDKIIRVSGFVPPPSGVPDAGATSGLLLVAMGLMVAVRRRAA